MLDWEKDQAPLAICIKNEFLPAAVSDYVCKAQIIHPDARRSDPEQQFMQSVEETVLCLLFRLVLNGRQCQQQCC